MPNWVHAWIRIWLEGLRTQLVIRIILLEPLEPIRLSVENEETAEISGTV